MEPEGLVNAGLRVKCLLPGLRISHLRDSDSRIFSFVGPTSTHSGPSKIPRPPSPTCGLVTSVPGLPPRTYVHNFKTSTKITWTKFAGPDPPSFVSDLGPTPLGTDTGRVRGVHPYELSSTVPPKTPVKRLPPETPLG